MWTALLKGVLFSNSDSFKSYLNNKNGVCFNLNFKFGLEEDYVTDELYYIYN